MSSDVSFWGTLPDTSMPTSRIATTTSVLLCCLMMWMGGGFKKGVEVRNGSSETRCTPHYPFRSLFHLSVTCAPGWTSSAGADPADTAVALEGSTRALRKAADI